MSRFSIIPASAVMDDSLTKADLKVLNTLGMYHNKEESADGWCYADYKTLANKAGCHRVTVIKSMKLLVDRGYLVIRPQWRSDGGQMCNEFKVLFDKKDDYDYYKNTKSIDNSNENHRVAKQLPPSSKMTTPPVADSLLPSSQATLPPGSQATLPPYIDNTNLNTNLNSHPPSEREKKISLEELSVEHLTEWIEQRKVAAKTPLDVNLDLCLEQMKAHYLANGGVDGNNRIPKDWVQKAIRWILEEQKKLDARPKRPLQAISSENQIISHSYYGELKRRKREGNSWLSNDDEEAIRQYEAVQKSKITPLPKAVSKSSPPPQKRETPPPEISPENREQMAENLKELSEQLRAT